MKKNNPYITDDEIDLGDLVRILWRKKILTLSISVIFGDYFLRNTLKEKL
jgi:uncharacterized protein involved in exopolysaccharide biosynthesis